MKTRMLLGTAAIALVTAGAAMAQSENRRSDDAPRPQAQTPDRPRGESPQPQARPQSQQQGQQGAQAPKRSQPSSTTGQAPQNGQAQSAPPSGQQPQRSQSTDQPRDQQRRSRAQGTQRAPAPAQGAEQRKQGSPSASGQPRQQGTQSKQSGRPAQQGTSRSQQSGTPSSQQGTSTQQSTAPAQQGSSGQQAGSVQLNDQQRSRISATISQQKVKPLTNVNFSVSVGTVVPRTVRVQTVPTAIVSIVPQYRGYSYFVVEDRIVIVEPKTKKIVTVIEQSGARGARAASPTKLDLTTEQRASIRRHATSQQQRATTGSRASSARISVGERVPDSIELQSFPSTVYEEVPVVREYRYFVRESDVVVVDPGEQRIIEIIR